MTAQNNDEMIQAYRDLIEVAHPVDRRTMEELLERDPLAAAKVVHEMSRIMMGAKCLSVAPDDRNFTDLCGELVALSMIHPEVRPIFKWISKYDLAHGEGDAMADPAMRTTTEERIERVLECLA